MFRDSSNIHCCIYNNAILNLKKVTPAISHVSQITDLAYRRRDTTMTTTGTPPPLKVTPHPNWICYKFWLDNMQYVKGRKKIQTPRILLRGNTIGDSEKHISLCSLSFIRISQYIINCIYRVFFTVMQIPVSAVPWLIRTSCTILFISRSLYSLCKWGWF